MQPNDFQFGERQFCVDDAERRARSAIAELGLSATLKCYGGDPTVWRCQLSDETGELPFGVVHVHIPGLEHFHLVLGGPTAVVPGQRGIAAAAR